MGVINHPAFPPAAAALIASRLLGKHSAGEIGAAIEILIDVLDLMGGDPDREDAMDMEDDFALSQQAIDITRNLPGCAISDQGRARGSSGPRCGAVKRAARIS